MIRLIQNTKLSNVLINVLFLFQVCWISYVIGEMRDYDSLALSVPTQRHLNSPNACDYQDLTPFMKNILCAVESKHMVFPSELSDYKYLGCLLDDKAHHGGRRSWSRCSFVRHIPTEQEVPVSPPPPEAKMKEYQRLAMIAESLVPKIWWREGYADNQLLLSHNVSELPKRLLNLNQHRSKKLKNIVACVTRQTFIRESLEFVDYDSNSRCSNSNVVKNFFDQYTKHKITFDNINNVNELKAWLENNGNFVMTAFEAFDYYTLNFGGIWKGCFGLQEDSYCRGGLAASSLVIGLNYLYEIVGKAKSSSVSNLIAGYMLASLGRGLLHGDKKSTGNIPITSWKVRLNDFTALQAAFHKLYIDSIGLEYSRQLDLYIPKAFPPSFTVHPKEDWKYIPPTEFEPVYTSLRNLMFTEGQILIDFGPYRPLVAVNEARPTIAKKQRRVLVDIGANGFFASPKYLLDSYAPYMPFTHAIMVEPEPHFSASVPKVYSERYNITFHQVYAEVGTGSATDMLILLPTVVTKDDFVVLKFDVDPNKHAQGPTMEWGFLFSLMKTKEIAELIDELYIELHFFYPQLYWNHYHSNWEALDAIRYLRENGVIVHAWP